MDNQIRNKGAIILAESKAFSGLRNLNLENCGIMPAGVLALARSETLNGLEEITLNKNEIKERGFQHLTASENFTNLKILKAGDVFIGDLAVKSIALSAYLGKLDELCLNGNNITRDGVDTLCNASNLKALKKIDFRRNLMQYEDCILLADLPRFKKMEVVRF